MQYTTPQQMQYMPQQIQYAPQQMQYAPQQQMQYAPQQQMQYMPQSQMQYPQQQMQYPQQQMQYSPQQQTYYTTSPQQTQYVPQQATPRTDPEYFREKERYFKDRAQEGQGDLIVSNRREPDDEYEYVLDTRATPVKSEPVSATKPIIKENRSCRRVKPNHGRYYDPSTKHYYKTSEVLEAIPAERSKKPDVWYPENPISAKTVYDPDTDEHFSVEKVYNDDGTYRLVYRKLRYRPIKYPGMDHYIPNWQDR